MMKAKLSGFPKKRFGRITKFAVQKGPRMSATHGKSRKVAPIVSDFFKFEVSCFTVN